MYHIDLDVDNVAETFAYCDFDGDFAWTLIASGTKPNWDYNNVGFNNLLNVPFYTDAPVSN